MSNSIRACFCIYAMKNEDRFISLLKSLINLDYCRKFTINSMIPIRLQEDNQYTIVMGYILDEYITLQNQEYLSDLLTQFKYINIKMDWIVNKYIYPVHISYTNSHGNSSSSVVFEIEEDVFLPGVSLQWTPHQDDMMIFYGFKQVIIECIKHLNPEVGVIDYEADVVCDRLSITRSLISWGNYFSRSILHQWREDDRNMLLQIVDEYIQVDGLGILTFIHPLAANQAWTPRHEQADALLRRNPTLITNSAS